MPEAAAAAGAGRRARARCDRARRRCRWRRGTACRRGSGRRRRPVPRVSHHDPSRAPRARSGLPLGDRCGVWRRLSSAHRQAVTLPHPVTQVDALERDVHRLERAAPRAWSIREGKRRSRAPAHPARARSSSSTSEVELREQRVLRGMVARTREARAQRAVARETTAARIFVPPTVHPDGPATAPKTARVPYAAGCRRPAERSPTASTGAGPSEGAVCRPSGGPEKVCAASEGRARRPATTTAGPGPKDDRPPPRARFAGGRELTIALVLIVAFFLAWSVIGYLVFRSGVSEANKRLPQKRAAGP